MSQMATMMWEAVAAAGEADNLVAWAREASASLDAFETRLFRSEDDRVVLIAWSRDVGIMIPPAPLYLVRRPPHQWEFKEVT